MTAPPIGRQGAERNRTKLHERIKHSMLMFTRKLVKNNSFYNSDGQKKIALEQK